MKKLFICILFAVTVFSAYSQVNPNAIGLRFGGGPDVLGAELSYQRGLSSSNRLEFDLGLGSSTKWTRVELASIYQWDWKIAQNFNWFAGPGATLGWWKNGQNDPGYFNVGLGGQVGIEYIISKRNNPIMLSLDSRPMWNFIGSGAGFGWAADLGIRYIW